MRSSPPIAVIINFCSNEYPFLRPCIEEAKLFADQLCLCVCDHFFDGVKEDRQVLNGIYAEHPDVNFIEFPFDHERYAEGLLPPTQMHNLARLLGCFFLKKEMESVLFLDCDEIMEGEKMAAWLSSFPYGDYGALSLANYWYFRECFLRAKTFEHTPLLVKRELLDGCILMNPLERAGIYNAIPAKKHCAVLGLDGKPMVHHYSWVRTKEQLLRKVQSWSHRLDRNWKPLVEEEFSREFKGTDFVHGYTFDRVDPFVEIDLHQRVTPGPKEVVDFAHVRYLKSSDVMKIDLSMTYFLNLWT